jgi:hypothetical protein
MAEDRELLAEKGVEAFMDRWMNDPTFADYLKRDTEGALRSCNIEPYEPLVKSLKDIDSSMPVEALKERVSKGTTLN